MARLSVVIVGSGFGGSILARILTRQGHEVHLIERGMHPRFALGESSTPLAAICLERLAARYGLEDLRDLAAYGRWLARMPEVRRGLKRGFTFYAHRPGLPYVNDERNMARLMVAASPSDAVADTHWLREDVDHLLVRHAVAEGVAYHEQTDVTNVEQRGAQLHVTTAGDPPRLSVAADLVVDASGAGRFLARALPLRSDLKRVPLRTGLIYGHFADVRPFSDAAPVEAKSSPGPYPAEKAAVHHVLDEGWMYVLPFDHGIASAGFVVDDRSVWANLSTGPAEEGWARLLDRYPTLAEQFGAACPLRPIDRIERLQRRLERAAGTNWALLPHAFCFLSPMFSTGIAWTLLGVERLALMLESVGDSGAGTARLSTGLERYGELLQTEADHLGRLIAGAYRARHDFDVFCAHTYLYFASVSYAEAAQRLLPQPPDGDDWAWDGFAGSTDLVFRHAVGSAWNRLARAPREPIDAERYCEDVRSSIRSRNVAGLAAPSRHRDYPVDLEALIQGADLLGLTATEVRKHLPRVRGYD